MARNANKGERPPTTLADLSGAPSEVELRDGVILLVSPLPLSDWGYLDRWIREEIIRAARNACEGHEALDVLILREAIRAAARVSITDPEVGNGICASVPAMLRMAFLSLRADKNNLDVLTQDRRANRITQSMVEKFFGHDLLSLKKVVEVITELSFGKDNGDDDDGESPRPPVEDAENNGAPQN